MHFSVIDKRLRGIAIRQNLTDEWKWTGASRKTEVIMPFLRQKYLEQRVGLTSSYYKIYMWLHELQAKSQTPIVYHMSGFEVGYLQCLENVSQRKFLKEKLDTI